MTILLIVFVGAAVYYWIGEGQWSWFDCVYMTVVTLSTVGYAETLPGFEDVPGARAVNLALIIMGSGTLLYFISNFTAAVVEGDLAGVLKRRRMQAQIDALSGHIIVCGAGSMGLHVVQELMTTNSRFVVIDADEEHVERVRLETGAELLCVIGDATDDHVLEAAGVRRCSGVILALHDDRDNVFAAVTVRDLNPDARIVAKAVELNAEHKLRRAGADTIVSANRIGGLRMVSEMIRPTAVEFLDRMLRERIDLRVEEIAVADGSALDGLSLAQSKVRDTGALVVAVRRRDGDYIYKPAGDVVIHGGDRLIIIAHSEDTQRLRPLTSS